MLTLLSNWKTYLLLILGISLVGATLYVGRLSSIIDKQQLELQMQEATIQQKESEIVSLVKGIETQNAAIEELKNETIEVKATLQAVASSNTTLINKMTRKISAIMTESIPKDCSGAVQNLQNYINEKTAEWNKP